MKIKNLKMQRKSFFKYSGMIALGIMAVASNPLKLFKRQKAEKQSTLKITGNPNAVSRTSNQRGANG